jgi:hypothetical protein
MGLPQIAEPLRRKSWTHFPSVRAAEILVASKTEEPTGEHVTVDTRNTLLSKHSWNPRKQFAFTRWNSFSGRIYLKFKMWRYKISGLLWKEPEWLSTRMFQPNTDLIQVLALDEIDTRLEYSLGNNTDIFSASAMIWESFTCNAISDVCTCRLR